MADENIISLQVWGHEEREIERENERGMEKNEMLLVTTLSDLNHTNTNRR